MIKQDYLLDDEISQCEYYNCNVKPLQNLRAFFKFENQVKNQENENSHAR